MQQESTRLLQAGKTIAFVPTMGLLHEGHLALMREGRGLGDALIVSIFVNPTQFGPAEDFQTYPRDLDRDLNLAKSVGVDVVFAPEVGAMYDKAFQTHVDLEMLPRHLCGPSRPGHFRGVATVVTKLFNIVRPLNIRVIGVPTVRESDGLAMSSRNTYLSEDERRSAQSLFHSLKQAQESVAEGIRDAEKLIRGASELIASHSHVKIDYVSICDPETLEDVDRVEGTALMALAVWVGKTRLIDNAILKPFAD
ncbi:MAG: pantoate--beta-alanine ligase [Deltaproteobacteria bacterium]|nr:pantoate--beta-alanine ligase [Deltaproteobacteria bacterium]